jgi:zinc protease
MLYPANMSQPSRPRVHGHRRVLFLVPLLLLLACAGSGLPEQPILPEQSFAQRDFRLPSGLRVLVQEDHSAPLVAVAAVYGIGSSLDPAGQEGLAHLTEHLTFRAGQSPPLDDRLRRVGASYNAMTELDTTTYFQLAHSDQLEALLEIEATRLAAPLAGVTPEILAVEIAVVRNELRQRHSVPGLLETLFAQAFGDQHPMGRKLGPEAGNLESIDLVAVQRFALRHYQPDNCTMVIAGDVSPDLVARLIGKWPAQLLVGTEGQPGPPRAHRPLPLRANDPPAPRSTAITRMRAPVDKRTLFLAWPAPADERAGDPFLQTALAGLGVILSSPIGDDDEPVLLQSRHGSLFAVGVFIGKDADPARVRERLLDRIVSTDRGARARRVLGLYQWMTGTETLLNSADLLGSTLSLAKYVAATNRTTFYKDVLERTASIDKDEITAFLEKYVNRERAITVLVEPDGTATNHDDAPGSAILGPNASPGAHDIAASPTISLLGMGTAEILKTARPPGMAALPHYRLGNGLDVILVPRHRAPVAEAFVRLPEGDRDLTPYGLANLGADWSSGTCGHQDFLLQVGGHLGRQTAGQTRRHTVRVFSGNLDNGLAALSDELRCRELNPGDLMMRDSRMEARDKALGQQSQKPGWKAQQAFWKALYPDESVGMRSRDFEALKTASTDEIEAAMALQYRPAGSLAVVVSDRPEADVRKSVETFFAGWEAPKPPVQLHHAGDASAATGARTVRVFDDQPTQQAYLRFGCRLPTASADAAAAYDVLEAVVQHEANELRSAWGATYGLDVQVVSRPHAIAHLLIKGAVGADRAGDVVARLLGFIDNMAKEGPVFKTFTLARWDLAREFNRRFATGRGMANAILEATDRGWPIDVWDRYPDQLANLSRATLRDLIAGCTGHEAVVLTGDKAVIEPQLAAHGHLP